MDRRVGGEVGIDVGQRSAEVTLTHCVASGDVDADGLGDERVADVGDVKGQGAGGQGRGKGEGHRAEGSCCRSGSAVLTGPAGAAVASSDDKVEGDGVVAKARAIFNPDDVGRSGNGEGWKVEGDVDRGLSGRGQGIAENDGPVCDEGRVWAEGDRLGCGVEAGGRSRVTGPSGAGSEVDWSDVEWG